MISGEEQKENCIKAKSRGKQRYVILRIGVFVFIGLIGVIVGMLFNKHHLDTLEIVVYSAIVLIIFGLFGLYAGLAGWKRMSQTFEN